MTGAPRCDPNPHFAAIDYSYSGRRTNTVARDGFNIVDYGEVTDKGCSTSSHACEFTWWAVGTGNAVESDIRLDQRDSYWTNDPAAFPTRVDFWSVMAHEAGHRSLFGHVSAGDTQVMDSGTPPGTSLKRKLSRGDAIGNNTKW